MPTAIEIQEPEIQNELSAPAATYVRGPDPAKIAFPARTLFSDCLLESGARECTPELSYYTFSHSAVRSRRHHASDPRALWAWEPLQAPIAAPQSR